MQHYSTPPTSKASNDRHTPILLQSVLMWVHACMIFPQFFTKKGGLFPPIVCITIWVTAIRSRGVPWEVMPSPFYTGGGINTPSLAPNRQHPLNKTDDLKMSWSRFRGIEPFDKTTRVTLPWPWHHRVPSFTFLHHSLRSEVKICVCFNYFEEEILLGLGGTNLWNIFHPDRRRE